ncbi:MAG: hypothetical protein ABI647_18460, partial [Gemmatimonadota bacterium]
MRLSAFLLLTVSPLAAQTQYQDPPPAIARILDAPLTPVASVSPDRKWLLLIERPSLPSIEEVAAPDLKLAGVRINPATNGSSRAFTATGLVLREIGGTVERRIATPAGARLGDMSWSPAADRVAFTVTGPAGIELWLADVATGAARRLTEGNLNGTFGDPCDWEPDAKGLVCAFKVQGRGAPPAGATVPAGPVIQESEGRSAPNRTYQDLLKDPADEQLFEHYFSSELRRVALDGATEPIGRPGVHSSVTVSPDGKYLLVTTLHRPFSYLVPHYRFPSRIEVWDRTGKVLEQLADVPAPGGGAALVRRGHRRTAPSSLALGRPCDRRLGRSARRREPGNTGQGPRSGQNARRAVHWSAPGSRRSRVSALEDRMGSGGLCRRE